MKLITYTKDEGLTLAILTAHGAVDVPAAARALGMADVPRTPQEFYAQGLSALPALDRLSRQAVAHPEADWLLEPDALKLGPAVPQPGKIICVGLNYRRHAAEAHLDVPDVPVLFSKFQNAIAAPAQDIPLPAVAEKYDYEAELAVVIGRRGKYIAEADALDYVLGYCNANDISARELQAATSQWLLGKSLDRFLPVGPYLLTADEAGDPQQWTVRCTLNGELRQNSNTSDMVFSVRELIAFISRHMTLEAGDIISTGTPEGVILGRSPRVWMKAGDCMTVEVGPLGQLTNQLISEEPMDPN